MEKTFKKYFGRMDYIIYGEFAEKYPLVNIFLYVRMLFLGVVGYQFEKKPGIFEFFRVWGFVAILFSLFGPVIGLILLLFILYSVSIQRKQYNNDLFFRKNYEKNYNELKKLEKKTVLFSNKKINYMLMQIVRIMSKFAEAHQIVMNYPGKAVVAGAFFGVLAISEIVGQRALLREHYQMVREHYDTHNEVRGDTPYNYPPHPVYPMGTGAVHTAGCIYESTKSNLKKAAEYCRRQNPPNDGGLGGFMD